MTVAIGVAGAGGFDPGLGELFVTVALLVVLVSRNLLEASERDTEKLRRLTTVIGVPLAVAFVALFVGHALTVL